MTLPLLSRKSLYTRAVEEREKENSWGRIHHEQFFSFSPKFCKFESNIPSDWLNDPALIESKIVLNEGC